MKHRFVFCKDYLVILPVLFYYPSPKYVLVKQRNIIKKDFKIIGIVIILIINIIISTTLNANDKSETNKKKPTLALVLSGGGARGLAQIGVLKELEKNNIYPDYIIGTSIGAIIGGLYAAGYSASQLDSIFRNIEWEQILSLKKQEYRRELFQNQKVIDDRNLLSLYFDGLKLLAPESISSNNQLGYLLQDLLWNAPYKSFGNFDKLKYKFRAVASDLNSGKSFALSSGSLALAIQASSTLPLWYSPIKIDSMKLVDGGLKSNIPIQEAIENFNPDLILVVNSVSPLLKSEQINNPLRIADQVVSIMMEDSSNLNLDKADIIIKPEYGNLNNRDYELSDTIIKLGSLAFIKKKHEILEKLKKLTYNKELNNNEDIIKKVEIINDLISADNKKKITQYLNKYLPSNNRKYINTVILNYFKKIKRPFAFIREYSFANNILKIKIDEGRLNKIIIKNNDAPNYLINRELLVKKDELLTPNNINKSWLNCRNSNYFSSVNFQLKKNNESGIDLYINAIKNPSQALQFGYRIDNERNTQVSFDYSLDNYFNLGERNSFMLMGGNRNFKTILSYELPRVWNSLYKVKFSFYYSNYLYNTYSDSSDFENKKYYAIAEDDIAEERRGFSFLVGSQLEKLGLFYLKYRLENQAIGFSINQNDFSVLSTGKIGLIIDTKNKTNFADEGVYFDLYLESNLFGDKENSFTKLYFTYETHLPLANHNLTPSIKFGYADKTLPKMETFALGGENSFFGFKDYQRRGRQIFISSLEYSYKIPFELIFDTYFNLRYDLGSVWEQQEAIKFTSLNHAIGFGLGLDTPIGPANFHFGKSFYFINSEDLIYKGELLFYFNIGMELD